RRGAAHNRGADRLFHSRATRVQSRSDGGVAIRVGRMRRMGQMGPICPIRPIGPISSRRIMNTLFQDLRYGARMLLKRPGFTVVAIATLALGIGVNTAIFSLINAVLIRPLPFREPDRLVWSWGNIRNGDNPASVSPLDYLDYRQQNRTFEQFAAMISVPISANLPGNGEPLRLSAAGVTGNFFQALGVQPALGRTFLLENEKPGSDQVVVLSHALWQKLFR